MPHWSLASLGGLGRRANGRRPFVGEELQLLREAISHQGCVVGSFLAPGRLPQVLYVHCTVCTVPVRLICQLANSNASMSAVESMEHVWTTVPTARLLLRIYITERCVAGQVGVGTACRGTVDGIKFMCECGRASACAPLESRGRRRHARTWSAFDSFQGRVVLNGA